MSPCAVYDIEWQQRALAAGESEHVRGMHYRARGVGVSTNGRERERERGAGAVPRCGASEGSGLSNK